MRISTSAFRAASFALALVLCAPVLALPAAPVDPATLNPYIYLQADTGVTTDGDTVTEWLSSGTKTGVDGGQLQFTNRFGLGSTFGDGSSGNAKKIIDTFGLHAIEFNKDSLRSETPDENGDDVPDGVQLHETPSSPLTLFIVFSANSDGSFADGQNYNFLVDHSPGVVETGTSFGYDRGASSSEVKYRVARGNEQNFWGQVASDDVNSTDIQVMTVELLATGENGNNVNLYRNGTLLPSQCGSGNASIFPPDSCYHEPGSSNFGCPIEGNNKLPDGYQTGSIDLIVGGADAHELCRDGSVVDGERVPNFDNGPFQNGTRFNFAGNLYEVIIFRENLDEANRAGVEEFLFAKYPVGIERPAVVIEESGGLTVVAEGNVAATDSYTVVLGSRPTGNAAIFPTFSFSQINVSPIPLTFTPDDWDMPQTITVTVVDDEIEEGTHETTITHRAVGGGYDLVPARDVVVIVQDNEVPPSATPVDPSTLSPFVHLRADAGVTTRADGTTVETWLDQADDLPFIPILAGMLSDPKLKTDTLGNQVIEFTDDWLRSDTGLCPDCDGIQLFDTDSSPLTIFVVFKPASSREQFILDHSPGVIHTATVLGFGQDYYRLARGNIQDNRGSTAPPARQGFITVENELQVMTCEILSTGATGDNVNLYMNGDFLLPKTPCEPGKDCYNEPGADPAPFCGSGDNIGGNCVGSPNFAAQGGGRYQTGSIDLLLGGELPNELCRDGVDTEDDEDCRPDKAQLDGVLGPPINFPGIRNEFTGDLAEVLIFKETLSNEDRRGVEQYLKIKYTVGVTAPAVLLTESGESTVVDEADPAATDDYTLVLGAQPLGNVEIAVSFDSMKIDVTPTSVVFTVDDWDSPQTLTVTVVDDAVAEEVDATTITHSVSGGSYDAVEVSDVEVFIRDNEPIPSATPVNPSTLTPFIHLRADQGVTTGADGSTVEEWLDQADDLSFIPILGGKESNPQLVSDELGNPTVRFDEDWLRSDTGVCPDCDGVQLFDAPNSPLTIFVVFNPLLGGEQFILDHSPGVVHTATLLGFGSDYYRLGRGNSQDRLGAEAPPRDKRIIGVESQLQLMTCEILSTGANGDNVNLYRNGKRLLPKSPCVSGTDCYSEPDAPPVPGCGAGDLPNCGQTNFASLGGGHYETGSIDLLLGGELPNELCRDGAVDVGPCNDRPILDGVLGPPVNFAAPRHPFQGYLSEIIIFKETLASADRRGVEQFLIDKYSPVKATVFRRGDCDQSGKVDFNDAIFHLRFLFLGENEDTVTGCKDACDSDDSGSDDFTDDINILKVLFLGQGDIPDPGPRADESHPCGVDPTEGDTTDCVEYNPETACP